MPAVGDFGFINPWPYYVTVAVIITVAMILLYRLQDSRLGRAWMAVREDELAAASMGINTVTTKLLAFAIGASTSGLAGVFYASKLGLVSPRSSALRSASPSWRWSSWAAWATSGASPRGRSSSTRSRARGSNSSNNFMANAGIPAIHIGFINIDLTTVNFLDYQYLLYGLALVGMMLLRPEGLFPSRRRRAELHDTEDADASNQELVEA